MSFTPSDSVAGRQPAPFERPGRQGWLRWLWSRREGRLEDIRRLMLAQLDSVADTERRVGLVVKIQSAADSEALWSVRGEWMQALAETQGQLLARQRLSDVSFMFAGLLDREQHARTGREVLQAEVPRGLVRGAAQMRAGH